MSSINRALTGDVLVHHLANDETLIDTELLVRHGRSARTLMKEGPLRLTLIEIAAGGTIPAHRADGPVTIHVIKGELTFTAGGADYPLAQGDLLLFAAGVEHSARSEHGGTFLLTVVHTDDRAPQ